MTTFATYADGSTIAASSGSNAAGYPATDVIMGTFDATKRTLAAADVVSVLNIPANTFVHKVFYKVTGADATQTMNVGDGSAVAGYVAAADVGTLGNSGVGAGSLAAGKFYAAADTIDIEVPSGKAFDTLKVKLVATVTFVG